MPNFTLQSTFIIYQFSTYVKLHFLYTVFETTYDVFTCVSFVC